MHRPVWGPGVSTLDAAIHYVDELILRALPTRAGRSTIVDLGCGLGASLLYLARRAELVGEGLTISQRQAARATELIARAGLSDRVRCREADYHRVPADLVGQADLAYSMRPDGTLLVCDDFLTSRKPPESARGARWLDEFRTGWRVGSLLTVEQVRDTAAVHGLELVRDVDLTPALRLRRPRDRLLTVLVAMGRPMRPSGEYWYSLLGGNALQLAIVDGLVGYHFLELRRTQ
jgi:SAM-dependent methyltransferase